MNPLKNLCSNIARATNSNLDILMGLSAIGGVAITVFLAIKETPEAEDIIYKAKEIIEDIEHDDDLPTEESEREIKKVRVGMVKKLIFNYTPTIISLILTILLIIGAVGKGRSYNALLTNTLNATNFAYQEYRDHVRDVIGKKEETEIYDDIREEHIKSVPIPENSQIIYTGNGQTLCYIELEQGDPDTGIYFWSSPEAIYKGLNELNAFVLRNENHCCTQSDALYFWGLKLKGHGVTLRGWRVDPDNGYELIDIRTSSHIHPQNGLPVLDIAFWEPPSYHYDVYG